MGQSKVYINLVKQIMFGIRYEKNISIEFNILCFIIGFGLTENAKGFDFWIQ